MQRRKKKKGIQKDDNLGKRCPFGSNVQSHKVIVVTKIIVLKKKKRKNNFSLQQVEKSEMQNPIALDAKFLIEQVTRPTVNQRKC